MHLTNRCIALRHLELAFLKYRGKEPTNDHRQLEFLRFRFAVLDNIRHVYAKRIRDLQDW